MKDLLAVQSALQDPGWISNHRYPRRHIFCNNRAHTDNRAIADGHALPEYSAGADIGAVADCDIAIAAHARGKGHIVSD